MNCQTNKMNAESIRRFNAQPAVAGKLFLLRWRRKCFHPMAGAGGAAGEEQERYEMKKISILMALTLTVPAIILLAAEGDQPAPPDGPGRRPPPPPIIAALDANHDGVIDADEIANASNALKTLDKNGDGKLTTEELRPPRPEGGRPRGGPDRRPGGPNGEKPNGEN